MTTRYLHARAWLGAHLLREEGQDLTEYAIVLGLIAVAVIIVVFAIGTAVSGLFDAVSAALPAAAPFP